MASTVFEFAEFKLDCGRFELLRDGSSMRLERKPMELLVLLVSSEGRLVTRDEIAKRLWDSEVFVDTEHGINTAIRKIRTVLRDDSERPRFIQTVTGMGYRFIAPVHSQSERMQAPVEQGQISGGMPEKHSSGAEAPIESVGIMRGLKPPPPSDSHRFRRAVWGVLGAGGMIAAAIVAIGRYPLAARLLHRDAQPAISSLAVLPLDNLSGDAGQDYFADGMTDELITMLAKSSILRVTSRTSVMQYKGVHRPLREIAQTLGVDGILEGSVIRTGNNVHLTIQLIQARTDAHLWAESYDRDLKDVVPLPREVAETIAKKLKSAVPSLPPARYVNPEAHDAYVHGRYLWTVFDLDKAQGYLKKAVELQPDYALGWSALADYYGAAAYVGDLDPRQALPQMEAAATKALQLDDSLAQAHLSMAVVYSSCRWDWASGDREALRAIELDPKFADAYYIHAVNLSVLNRHQEAITVEKEAMEIDPFSRPYALAASYAHAREFDAALKEGLQRLESTPNHIGLIFTIADTYWDKGMGKEAVEFEVKGYTLQGDNKSASGIRRAFQEAGSKGVARWRIGGINKSAAAHYVSPMDLASAYGELGEKEKTLALLEEAYRQRAPSLIWVQCDPRFDFLHSDERYRSIIRGMGLPPAW